MKIYDSVNWKLFQQMLATEMMFHSQNISMLLNVFEELYSFWHAE